MYYDLPLEELRKYKPKRTDKPDFDAFWARTLAAARSHPLDARFVPYEAGLPLLSVFDVTFAGFDGQPIKGWLLEPRDVSQSPFERNGKLPCLVEYIGYGGGRGRPADWLHPATSGFAHLVMDSRGQGSTWRPGDTPDVSTDDQTGQQPGFATRGITSPDTYYYRRIITDGVRAVEAARSAPGVDPQRVAITGVSQGGGITMGVAGLVPDLLLAMPDVPFMCNWQRAWAVQDSDPYGEVVRWCKVHRDLADKALATLTYHDGMNFAARAKAPALFSVALMDVTCPPSTVFSAYNHYAGPKSIEIYPFNGHEGGETIQNERKMARLAEAAKA